MTPREPLLDVLEQIEERNRALDYTRDQWRQRVGIVRTLAIVFGLLLFGAWWAQEDPYREPLSINLHGEQAMAVIGLALLIFGVGAWVGLHLPEAPSKRANRLRAAGEFEDRAESEAN